MNISGFIGAIIVPLLIGKTVDKYSGILNSQQVFNKAFAFCFFSYVLAFIFIFLMKETGCQNIWNTLSKKKKVMAL